MKNWIKYSIIAICAVTLIAAISMYYLYNELFIRRGEDSSIVIYINKEHNLDSVYNLLTKDKCINVNHTVFNKFATLKNYTENIKPGRYIINNMTVNEIVNKLRIANQDALNFTFISTRNIGDILLNAQESFMSIDSLKLATTIQNSMKESGFDNRTIPALFIPNTYSMLWTTTEEELFARLINEYKKYWNEKRIEQAKKLGLTPIQVATLASIIDEESSYIPEYKRIAGVYINRLKKGMKLEADPTLKYANNDFGAKRVLDRHKLIDSPYNTYMYAGLPPGPIRVPSLQAIDAVLNAENHNFIFFCANSDFSGRHLFAKTLSEHNKNARRYRNALQQRKIYR